MSLQRALLLLIAIVLLVGLVPAGVIIERRLAGALEDRTREELALAPRILADRNQARADVLMMHAKDLASSPALAEALARGDLDGARRLASEAALPAGEQAVLVDRDGRTLAGVAPTPALLDSTRTEAAPITVFSRGADAPRRISLAPVRRGGEWVGAAGVATRLGPDEAGTLAGLTRARVVILRPDGEVAASTAESTATRQLVAAAAAAPADGVVREWRTGGRRWLVTAAPLGGAGTVLFARDLAEELAVLPELRRMALVVGLLALALSLALGALVAARVARPVGALADAADRLAAGDFEAALAPSGVREVRRVSQAFDDMRRALAGRLADLRAANRELEDRQARLGALQAELIQRDRVAATGRLVAQLAHEIRNPVANVRNLLELLRRRLAGDADGRRLADVAIDELLRMHELAEQMLTLNRPRSDAARASDGAVVVAEVASLARAGVVTGALDLRVTGEPSLPVAIAPDALKQVLVNLVQNAREATGDAGRIEIALARVPATSERDGGAAIDVLDSGPGIAPEALPRIFDPFFTTKGAMQGVGLGLFVAEGIVRSAGGRITAENRAEGGARFRVELPLAAGAAGAAQPASSGDRRAADEVAVSSGTSPAPGRVGASGASPASPSRTGAS